MCRTCRRRHNSYDLDPSSGTLQDISLEYGGSVPFPLGLRSSGKFCPLRGRNMKEYEEQLTHLKNENFSLKLRVYFLEERIGQKGLNEEKEDLCKANMELKVETEALKKQLQDKQELVRQASVLLATLEDQYKEQVAKVQQESQREKEELRTKVEMLEQEIENHTDKCRGITGDLTQLCGLAFDSAGYEEPSIGLTRLPFEGPGSYGPLGSLPPAINGMVGSPMQGMFSLIEDPDIKPNENGCVSPRSFQDQPCLPLNEEPQIPDAAAKRIKELETKVVELQTKVQDLQQELSEKQRVSDALEEDVANLKKEIEEQEDKLADLETEVNEKDEKVDQLMQDLETRHLEIKAKDSTIQNLHDDLIKVEPEIEIKVQEIYERDRIIEEKIEQLQQQNKILVEIQITLDEKQKQIAELEASLQEALHQLEERSKQLDVSDENIKGLVDKLVCVEKDNHHLKKDVARKEKKIRDLMAELKESLGMLQKATWEAETSCREDGVKEMAEDEHEGLWAELEQRKAELKSLQCAKDAALQEADEQIQQLRRLAEELTNKLNIQNDGKEHDKTGDRDKNAINKLESEIETLRCKANIREEILSDQRGMIITLKHDLSKTREDLQERKDDLREMKNELSRKNDAVQDFIINELFGRRQEVKDLQGKLLSGSRDSKSMAELKKILQAAKFPFDMKKMTSKHASIVQLRSNSLSELENPPNANKGETKNNSSSPKPGRSNSFSTLENALFAHMGQKVCNTNQTFNTYVIPGMSEDDKSNDTSITSNIIPYSPSQVPNIDDLPNKLRNMQNKFDSTTKDAVNASGISMQREGGDRLGKVDNKNLEDTNAIQLLYEEMSKIRGEAQALRQEREILSDKLNSLQCLSNRSSRNGSAERDNVLDAKSTIVSLRKELEEKKIDNLRKDHQHGVVINDFQLQIENLKDELKNDKKRITLQLLEVASRKYDESLKNYKQEIASLRKRLADSHNACDILRTRLGELVDYLEQMIEMDNNGIINLDQLPIAKRASLQTTLKDSRELSHSLSQSLMIGADSTLEGLPINDESSRFSILINSITEEIDLIHPELEIQNTMRCVPEAVNRIENLSFDMATADVTTEDFIYQNIASKINSELDSRTQEINSISMKVSQMSNLIQKKDIQLDSQTGVIFELKKEIEALQDDVIVKDKLLMAAQLPPNRDQCHQIGKTSSSIFVPSIMEIRSSSLDMPSNTRSSVQLSAFQTLVPSMSDVDFRLYQQGLFINPEEPPTSSTSDTLPPAFTSKDEFIFHDLSKTVTTDEIQYIHLPCDSTDMGIECIDAARYSPSLRDTTPNYKMRNDVVPLLGVSQPIEEPALLMLASPSESEAWSEPDRNVSLARIGLETCILASSTNDRSISRARMNRSTPLSSESDIDLNIEECKENGSPSVLAGSVIKSKRRSDASEVKRLSSKLKDIEQLNETLRAELHIYQTLSQHYNTPIMTDPVKEKQVISRKPSVSDKSVDTYGEPVWDSSVLDEVSHVLSASKPLLQEIHSLRRKLEEAIVNNDLLRDQLEAALAGYLSEEARNLTSTLAAAQQDLRVNKEQLLTAASTEQYLRNQFREAESKTYDVSERLADYMTRNQELDKVVCQLKQDLTIVYTSLSTKEDDFASLKNIQSVEEENSNMKTIKLKQKESEVASLTGELESTRCTEQEKERRLEEQSHQITTLELQINKQESRLSEQNDTIAELCRNIADYQAQHKSFSSEQLIQNLQDALLKSESRLIQMTKDRFSLVGERSRLRAQLASVTTQANLLQKEIEGFSDSEDSSISEIGYDRVLQRLRISNRNIKVAENEKQMLHLQKQALRKELELMQEEVSSLRSHLDHLLSKEVLTNSRAAREFASLQASYSVLENNHIQLRESYAKIQHDKSLLEEKLANTNEQSKKNQEQKRKENSAKFKELNSQIEAERCLTRNLQGEIRNLQIQAAKQIEGTNDSSSWTSPTSATSMEFFRPLNTGYLKDLQDSSLRIRTHWTDSKDNIGNENSTYSFCQTFSPRKEANIFIKDSLHVDIDGISGESPDLGIGSDGQFSSLDRKERYQGQKSWQAKLCSDPSHSQLIREKDQLRRDKSELSERLNSTKETLKEALQELTNANERKQSVERAICRQLSKTHEVLQNAKGNLKHSIPANTRPRCDSYSKTDS